MDTPSTELPQYRSHKIIRAAKILSINGSVIGLATGGMGSTVIVPSGYLEKHQPLVGGYYVVYADGYTSFSPALAFEEGYTLVDGPSKTMNFGPAIEAVKRGKRVARAGWNGKGMFIYLNLGSHDFSKGPIAAGEYINGVNSQLFDGGQVETATRMPNFNMRAADGSTVTGWLASQTDMLAEDWVLVP